jgi:hypothetical protein
MWALFIALLFATRGGQALDLSAGYLLKLGLSAFTRLGDKKQN